MKFIKNSIGGVCINLDKDDVLRILDSNNYQLIDRFQYEIEADEEYLSDLDYIGERFHGDIAEATFYAASEENEAMFNFIREALIYIDLVFANEKTDDHYYSIENSYGPKELIFELIHRIHNQQGTFDKNEELAEKYRIHYDRIFTIYKELQWNIIQNTT